MSHNKEVYLVIGGEGFLGRHLVNLLLERRATTHPNCEIRIFDIAQRLEWPSHVKFIKGDLCNFNDLATACEGSVTTIFQTASPLPNSPRDVLYKVNIDGMKNVIKVCQSLQIKKLVFTSSCSVVYDGSPLRNVKETYSVTNHLEDYSHTKYLSEKLVLEATSENLKTCSLRLAGLFGPGDRQNLPGFLGSFDKGQSSTAIGDNENLFDFTYVENAAYAHILASDKLDSSDEVSGEAFFITNGTPVPFFNNARKFLTFFGAENSFYRHLPFALALIIAYIVTSVLRVIEPFCKVPWNLTPFVVYNATADRYFDISKARKLLGYEPLYTLEEGVRKSAKYFIEERKTQGITRPNCALDP